MERGQIVMSRITESIGMVTATGHENGLVWVRWSCGTENLQPPRELRSVDDDRDAIFLLMCWDRAINSLSDALKGLEGREA